MVEARTKIAGILITISVSITTFGLLNTFGLIKVLGQFEGSGLATLGTFFFVMGFWIKTITLQKLKKWFKI